MQTLRSKAILRRKPFQVDLKPADQLRSPGLPAFFLAAKICACPTGRRKNGWRALSAAATIHCSFFPGVGFLGVQQIDLVMPGLPVDITHIPCMALPSARLGLARGRTAYCAPGPSLLGFYKPLFCAPTISIPLRISHLLFLKRHLLRLIPTLMKSLQALAKNRFGTKPGRLCRQQQFQDFTAEIGIWTGRTHLL